jgi:hypothetical protein
MCVIIIKKWSRSFHRLTPSQESFPKGQPVEPSYESLDPEERNNKFLAFVSVALGMISLCGGIIPFVGIILGLLGLGSGLLGRKSANRRIATIGIVLSSLGLLITFVYMIFLYIQRTALAGG